MRSLSIISRAAVLGLFLSFGAAVSSGQGYYDDDIYFDASKAAKETSKKTNSTKPASTGYQGQYYYDGAQYVPWNNVGDYQAADSYQVTGSSTRDVDEYNRRTIASGQVEHPDSITLGQFEEMSNTRNLARFHNSAEAQQAYAENMAASTYDYDNFMPQTSTVINVNVVDPWNSFPYYYPYYSYYPYYTRPWYWNSWGYDPFWGPSWSYYPSWSWGCGWHGPSWAWGGPHYHGWSGVRPHYTSPGAYAPNVINRGNAGTYRGNSTGRYTGNSTRGSAAGSLGTRPAYNGSTGNRGRVGTSSRPGYRSPTYTPGGTSNGNSGVTRGRNVGKITNGTTTRPQNTNSYNNNRNSHTNSNSYNYNSNSGTRGRSGSSSGSFGTSGSSRGGYSGGASRGSSGGGRRGR